ncbi:fructosamine kinase family protein [Cyanobium sp. FGCU-6]|jgi:fructosamine-3-kinase|nr:fructosamine kinase family protein [Cyanobium sp. FGCU6]
MPPAADPLAAWLQERLGAALVRRRPVGGGCIHQAWCLELVAPRAGGPSRLFAKTSPPEGLPLLEAEAEGLRALAAAAAGSGLVVPEPLALELTGGLAVLVLPWLNLEGGGGGGWGALGASLARLHRSSLAGPLAPQDRPAAFGWERANFIGSTSQVNTWSDAWGAFFASRRLAPQLEELGRRGIELADAQQLLELVPGWLAGHQPEACLVHGDLWSGNASLLAGAAGTVFDPAVHRADREVDLAMARLFGGFPEAFFAGYEREWPLPQGHRARVDLYNLYHLLNHAQLFGGGYVGRSRACIAGLLREPPC